MKTTELDTRKTSQIKLPSSLKNGKVFVFEYRDTMVIKKTTNLSLSKIRDKLKKIKGQVLTSEINQEVQDYRKGH